MEAVTARRTSAFSERRLGAEDWGDAGTQAIAAACSKKPGEAILLPHPFLGRLVYIPLCAIPELEGQGEALPRL